MAHKGSLNVCEIFACTYPFQNVPSTCGDVGPETQRFVQNVVIHFSCVTIVKWRLRKQQITYI